jgi:hypothetical protein
MRSLLTSFVGADPFGTVIFGSVDSGPLLGTEAVLVAGFVVVAGITIGLVAGGFSVCAWDGAGMMCAVSALPAALAVFEGAAVEPHAASANAAASVVNGSSRERIDAGRLANLAFRPRWAVGITIALL